MFPLARQVIFWWQLQDDLGYQRSSVPSHVTDANSYSQGPSLCQLPKYAQQDAAADLDLDPSALSRKDPNSTVFGGKFFD